MGNSMGQAECRFCGLSFRNRQGVRAHLRSCKAYRAHKSNASGSQPEVGPIGTVPKAGMPQAGRIPQPSQSIRKAGEVEPLQPRELRETHRYPDEWEEAQAKRKREEMERVTRETREGELVHQRAELEDKDRRHREAVAAEAKRRRIKIIQEVIDEVIGGFWSLRYTIPTEAKAQALQDVRQKLSSLQIDEIPRRELVEIATGLRDRTYRPVMAAQDEIRRKEEEARNEAHRHEEERREKEHKREQNRQAKIDSGRLYAEQVLKDATGMDSWDQRSAMQEVEKALGCEITGDEAQDDIEEVVERVLDPLLEEHELRAEMEWKKRRKDELIKYGEAYAREEVANEKDLSPWDRQVLHSKIRRELEAEVDGDESEADVADLVEEILNEELGEGDWE